MRLPETNLLCMYLAATVTESAYYVTHIKYTVNLVKIGPVVFKIRQI